MNYALFRKPSRYIGNEINIIRKKGNIRVALCFPDTYEIGMSHLGLKILYEIINNLSDASAERVYAPWVDMETHLRKNNIPLTSLEFQRPLNAFDLVGFTLQYELSYTNVLTMLDLGGIPVKAADRAEHHPIVLAGGPCAVNPLPLAPFIDAFVIGDGEEIIVEIIETFSVIRDLRSGIIKRSVLLEKLAGIDGIYVPSIHDGSGKKVKKRIVDDLEKAAFPNKPLLPYTAIVHDRIAIEISRGCTKGCRFCQAGMTYRPLRERSLAKVQSLAQHAISSTGYDEISFTSLSAGDYSALLPLIRNFNKQCEGSHIAVSLPSLRVGAISSALLQEIKSIRKTGFTIAPEAGTKRLRNVINKDFTDEEYEDTLKKLFSMGWRNIKLYFMIGLPSETMTDIDGLIDMAIRASKKGREIAKKRITVNVGLSVFVPKPHTPFQWPGQESLSVLREKQDYIRKAFRKQRINFKGQHVENSLLEAVFSRGDSKSATLLEEAWKLGCRFDGWSEHFDFYKWLLASQAAGMNLYEYASRSYAPDDPLPWDFIDTGITKSFLKAEFQSARDGMVTPDCRNVCGECGINCHEKAQKAEPDVMPTTYNSTTSSKNNHLSRPACRTKMRIQYSKTGSMRYLSHHELMTSFLRAMRRASIPMAYSAGFHPHPKVSFGPALAAGVEGIQEYFDVELTILMSISDFLNMLNAVLPRGLEVLSAAYIALNERSLNETISCYEYEVHVDEGAREPVMAFMNSLSFDVVRDDKKVDIRPMVSGAKIDRESLWLRLTDTDRAKARLHEILQAMLQKSPEEIMALSIKRTGLYGYNRVNQGESEKRRNYGGKNIS